MGNTTKKMDARSIFSCILKHDVWSYISAYNDTIDPRRSWTLCGRLEDDQKDTLRTMIHSMAMSTWSQSDIAALQQINHRVIDDQYYSCILRQHLGFLYAYDHPWIYHASNFLQPYHNTATYIDEAGESGIVSPAVLQIIIADTIKKRRKILMTWDLPMTKKIHVSYAEARLLQRSNDDVRVIDILLYDKLVTINEFCAHDVFECFAEVNPLISTPVIWEKFGRMLITRVTSSMSAIIAAIQSTRMCRNHGMAHFVNIPSDDHYDITIVTTV